jgi:uncharacterized repeat protein (TIGR01451 family)
VGSNVAESSSSSAGGAAARTQASAATVVLQPDLKVELTGPKEQILGRAAGYEIVVSNPGDTVLANVIVSSPVPKDATNVVAKDALIQNGQATWTIPELKTGAQLTRTLSYSSSLAGTINCNATAASGNLRKNAQASTVWRGVGGLLLQASESPDPVEVGDTCTYSITVANQGFGDLHNLKIVAQFPEQLDPISSPNGNVSGKTVNLLTFPVLEGGKEVVFTILAKGVKPGDGHTKITLSCDEEKYSLKEENTTVY